MTFRDSGANAFVLMLHPMPEIIAASRSKSHRWPVDAISISSIFSAELCGFSVGFGRGAVNGEREDGRNAAANGNAKTGFAGRARLI